MCCLEKTPSRKLAKSRNITKIDDMRIVLARNITRQMSSFSFCAKMFAWSQLKYVMQKNQQTFWDSCSFYRWTFDCKHFSTVHRFEIGPLCYVKAFKCPEVNCIEVNYQEVNYQEVKCPEVEYTEIHLEFQRSNI